MEPVAVEPITRVGTPEQLSAAREARGWSRSDIAAKLGMMPRQIEAIEQGRWEALPGHAFVRGAIRAYGKTLQVDVAPLLAALGAQAGVPELRASSSLDSPLPRHGALGFDNGGSGSRIVWILLGIAGVVAIAMYFGRGADFGGVLEPGTPSGRAVDAVPLVPGSISGDGGSPAQPGAGSACERDCAGGGFGRGANVRQCGCGRRGAGAGQQRGRDAGRRGAVGRAGHERHSGELGPAGGGCAKPRRSGRCELHGGRGRKAGAAIERERSCGRRIGGPVFGRRFVRHAGIRRRFGG